MSFQTHLWVYFIVNILLIISICAHLDQSSPAVNWTEWTTWGKKSHSCKVYLTIQIRVKNQNMRLQRTVSIAERREPMCRWEKDPGGHLPPCNCTNLNSKADQSDECLTLLKRHVTTECKSFALFNTTFPVLKGPRALTGTHFNISENKRKGNLARTWSAEKNAEYLKNGSLWCYTWEEYMCCVCQRFFDQIDSLSKNHLSVQCFGFSIHLQKTKPTKKTVISTDFIMKPLHEKT